MMLLYCRVQLESGLDSREHFYLRQEENGLVAPTKKVSSGNRLIIISDFVYRSGQFSYPDPVDPTGRIRTQSCRFIYYNI